MFNLETVQSWVRQRKFDDVIHACESELKNPEAHENTKRSSLQMLGTTLYLKGEVSRSIDCFKKLLNLDPKNTEAAISLSVIYNDIGKYEEAKRVYQIANSSLQLKRQGSDPALDRKFAIKHIELGDLYVKYHRYDDSLNEYSRAIQLAPSILDTRIKLAKVYAKKGFTTRAIQELQQLSQDNPEYVQARVQLGLVYYSLGNIIDAQLEWEKAQKSHPTHPELASYLEMARGATETSL